MGKLIAACNITGPNGELIVAADPENNTIPEDWPEDFVADLVRGGAAVDPDVVADTVDEALEEEA
jgi:hypothetical protein